MYVHVIPNRKSPPAILLREAYREGGKSRSRTIANISGWPPECIEALARALKGEFDGVGSVDPVTDRIFGVLFVLKELADRIGLSGVLGKTRVGKLVLFLDLSENSRPGLVYPRCDGPRIIAWPRFWAWASSMKTICIG
jgi:hypothetical protein